MSRIAVYPGTFDPITNGHLDLIKRALKIFDKIIVAVAENTQKKPLFPIEQRIHLVETVVSGHSFVDVCKLDKLVVELAKEHSANVILRGLRAVSDFEYEVQLAGINRSIEPSIESVFMSPADDFAFLSSSIVKDIARHRGKLGNYVHPEVEKCLIQKFK
tara:strand:+ start:170 stop:649 length:480 start_codon:yes stop_codon:yes gene_type:complete